MDFFLTTTTLGIFAFVVLVIGMRIQERRANRLRPQTRQLLRKELKDIVGVYCVYFSPFCPTNEWKMAIAISKERSIDVPINSEERRVIIRLCEKGIYWEKGIYLDMAQLHKLIK